ncbi:hypothetical protein GF345_04235 [Candidatus Woesearchaeota archaeon]|nr:hypothetical protein [Candidatus Woesearchaeota archaeon]
MPDIISAKKVLGLLEASSAFSEWRKDNPEPYLCHIFFILKKDSDQCQIGYYDKEKDLITSFDVEGEDASLHSTEKPFKPEGMKVNKTDISKVNIDFKEAIAIVEDLQKTKYPAEMPVEIIAILQNIDGIGIVYNITHVTKSFKTLNVKVSADNGDIMDEQLVSIVQFPQKDTGQ